LDQIRSGLNRSKEHQQMKHHRDIAHPVGAASDGQSPKANESARPGRKRRRRWRGFGLFLLLLVAVAGVGRAVLPSIVRDYVNRTLDRHPLYAGNIGEVEIHLWRGAYSIQDVRISKTTGNIPVPFFAAKRVDFAIEWNALLHRRVVGRVLMEQPQINFVDAATEGETQSGGGAPWLQIIRDLFPFKINKAVEKPVDVYLSQVAASIDNLTNIRDETNPLVSTVTARGLAMDHAKFEYKMSLDPCSYRPTFHVATRVLGLDVTKINDLALAYGRFDFKRGWFDLVLEADAKEGQLTGYVKPLFRDLKVFSLTEDLKEANVFHFLWQGIVGATASLFKNQPRDQFGTLIPFSRNLSGTTTTDILATVGNVLRNAFVRAYLPRLESGQESVEGLTFDPPEFTDPISAGDTH
jgi:hypothetical protein